MRDDGWGDRGGDRVGRGAVVVVGCGRGHGVEDYYLVALSELVGGVLLVWVGEREAWICAVCDGGMEGTRDENGVF